MPRSRTPRCRTPRTRSHRARTIVAAAALVGGLLAGTAAPATAATRTWKSGAAGLGAADGRIATWRGTPLDVVATWADSGENTVNFWQLDPGGQYGSWTKNIDIAVGAFDGGGSWAAAASGAYDARWRTSLTTLKRKWGSRAGTVYIRFAHEMNGNWYPWKVTSGNSQQFIAAWKRYRAIQKSVFPAAKLVFCPNRESIGNGIDWRKTFPGAGQVDVMGVDYYNQWPYAATVADFTAQAKQTDGYGAPKGIAAHLAFARSVGLPLAVSEWSGNAGMGDSPGYVQGMQQFFAANGGTGAGKLLYEVQFNEAQEGGNWLFYGGSRMPKSAAKYRDLF
ncbi:glycosyl hydrolase [Kineococcus glutinatus]|uniref:GH26 domain-containing protein n=1 Tax=Kineococcus glutinatus TaxID=1070872 RepID=A0ABP9I9K0_9ACTN